MWVCTYFDNVVSSLDDSGVVNVLKRWESCSRDELCSFEVQSLLGFFDYLSCVVRSGERSDVDAKELKGFQPPYLCLLDVKWHVPLPLPPRISNHLLGLVCVKGEIIFLPPDLPPHFCTLCHPHQSSD